MRPIFLAVTMLSLAALAGCQSAAPPPDQGRLDVEEAAVPLPPDGPASPDPSCNPANAQC